MKNIHISAQLHRALKRTMHVSMPNIAARMLQALAAIVMIITISYVLSASVDSQIWVLMGHTIDVATSNIAVFCFVLLAVSGVTIAAQMLSREFDVTTAQLLAQEHAQNGLDNADFSGESESSEEPIVLYAQVLPTAIAGVLSIVISIIALAIYNALIALIITALTLGLLVLTYMAFSVMYQVEYKNGTLNRAAVRNNLLIQTVILAFALAMAVVSFVWVARKYETSELSLNQTMITILLVSVVVLSLHIVQQSLGKAVRMVIGGNAVSLADENSVSLAEGDGVVPSEGNGASLTGGESVSLTGGEAAPVSLDNAEVKKPRIALHTWVCYISEILKACAFVLLPALALATAFSIFGKQMSAISFTHGIIGMCISACVLVICLFVGQYYRRIVLSELASTGGVSTVGNAATVDNAVVSGDAVAAGNAVVSGNTDSADGVDALVTASELAFADSSVLAGDVASAGDTLSPDAVTADVVTADAATAADKLELMDEQVPTSSATGELGLQRNFPLSTCTQRWFEVVRQGTWISSLSSPERSAITFDTTVGNVAGVVLVVVTSVMMAAFANWGQAAAFFVGAVAVSVVFALIYARIINKRASSLLENTEYDTAARNGMVEKNARLYTRKRFMFARLTGLYSAIIYILYGLIIAGTTAVFCAAVVTVHVDLNVLQIAIGIVASIATYTYLMLQMRINIYEQWHSRML